MIDWQKADLKDFQIQVEGDSIQESGEHIVFPVRVYHRDGRAVFTKSVPVRSEFYRALKKTPDWQQALMQILRQRIRDDLVQRFQKESVSVEEKIDFIQTPKQSI